MPVDRLKRRQSGASADDGSKARRPPLAMIDRGAGYEKMLRGEHRPRMR